MSVPAFIRGLTGALKLGAAWALLGPFLALCTAAFLGTLAGGWWGSAMCVFVSTLFYALLLSSWPAHFADRQSPDHKARVLSALRVGALMGALIGLGMAGLSAAYGLNGEEHSLHEMLRRTADVFTGQMPAFELPPGDSRRLDAWYYVKMLGALGVVAGGAREPAGMLWNRLRPRRNSAA
ncbi:MAG: hypothetical protein EXS22_03600 [Pedosphaera sp.]|nr:hypothetical protein [Pedosphaera sp.]